MASELLKNRALIQKLKEPEVSRVKFNLASTGFEELFTLPESKPQELLDIQEDNRKGRLLESLNKIGGRLEDSSLDFIRRENFSKAGIAKVVDYVNSLPDGTEVSIKDIREYIEKNNIDASSKSISNIIGGSAPGRERFKPSIKFVEQLGSVKYNEDTFKKIDELLEDPKITSFRNLGEELGYKTPKPSGKRGVTVGGGTPLSRQSPIIKAYVKSRGGDPFEGFKVNFYERGQPKVEQTLKLQADGMSTNSIADKLFKGNRTNVRRIFRLFRPEAIKDPTPKSDDPTTTTKTRASARRQKREAEAFKKVGEKTAAQTKKVINTIKDKNADILKMSDAEILNDPKIRYAMSIDATGLRMNEPLKFDKYSDLSDKEFVKKVRDKAKAKTFYTPEHISEVAKEKLNTAFPNNLVNAPGRMGSQVQAMKEYLRKNPDGEFANQIDEVLSKTGMQFKTEGKTFGVKENIEFNSKTNKSNIVENYFQDTKPITAGQKKLTALQEIMQGGKNVGVDPSLLMKAGFEEFVKPTGKFAGQVARGVGTAADLAISAGKGGTGLALGALLEADPIITGMSEGKTFGQTARDTFVGSAIDLIPGVNLGSLNEDLIKLADTEEQRIAIQNLIDYQKDYDRFTKDLNAFKSYNQLNQVELEELGFTASDLVDIENKLAKRFEDIQTRAPKVYNPEVFSLARELATKEAIKRKENLETGIAGKIFGDFAIKNPNFIENQIQQIMAASTGAEGATDSYTDNYRFLPQEQVSPEELDQRFDMEGGIMAANGGRIGFADGPMDPKRRTFMKIMAGIASLPIFSKFIGKSEVAKPIVKIAGSSTKMPDWFPDLINKAMFSGTGKKIDADIMKYEVKELPGIEIYRHDDGKVFVSGKNEYGKSYEIEYEPPGYELIDEKTGKAVKKPGEFIAQEEVPVNVDPDGNADFDVEVLEDLDQLLGSDTRVMEEFATGKKIKEMKSGEYNVGQAEVRAEQAADEAAELGVLDEID